MAPYAACLLILVALVDSQIVASIAPQIAEGLGSSDTTIASGVTIYALFAAAVALGLAWIPTRPAPRRWLPISAAVFAVANIASAAAPNAFVFLAGRALTGFAAGLISALAISALANASSYERRGSQMSLVAISYFLAPVVGVPIGTLLAGAAGWRTTFVVSAVAVALAGALVRVLPLTRANDVSDDEAVERPAGTVGAVAYLWRLANRNTSTRMGVVSAFFVSGGLVGFTSFVGIWLNDSFGAKPESVSLVYAIAGAGAVVGGALGGKLADRFGKRRMSVLGSMWLAIFLAVVPAFAWGVSLFALVAATAFAASLRIAPLQALITELVPAGERATFVALRNASSQLGIAASVALCGLVYEFMGMMGVGLICVVMTVFALFTTERIDDPGVGRPRRKMTVGRQVLRLAAGLLVFVLVVLPWMIAFVVTKAVTRPDEATRHDDPSTYGEAFEPAAFASVDGNTLSGWYLPSHGTGVTIVMSHGLFRSRYELLKRGLDFAHAGYGVVLYDLRRHGESNGAFTTLGYAERHDVEAAAKFARERAPNDRLVLFGVSMGAAATLLAAAETDGVAAVVADSSFLSLTHTIYHHVELTHGSRVPIPTLPFAPELTWFLAGRMSFLPGAFDVLGAVQRVRCPILFIGGTDDVRMPIDSVLDPLYDAAQNPEKRRFVVQGASHGHAYDTDPPGYDAAVFDFLRTNVPPAN